MGRPDVELAGVYRFDVWRAVVYSGRGHAAERLGGSVSVEEESMDARERRENSVAEEHSRESLGRALGMIPSGIFVVTAARESVRSAYVGSWIQQAAFAPPAITIAMNQQRPLLTLLEPGHGMGVHILGRRQAPLYAHFEKGFSLDEDPFVGVEINTVVTGAPILREAFAYLDCRVRTMIEAGDHMVILAEVLAGAASQSGEPMTYTRRSGFTY
jgi:3-hydroxy-9,10-secoandrosta-1,3,5(10)-triene-9,17-dione monooxygenase reductase component